MSDFVCNASSLIFGPSKSGKSHLAATSPQPVLILDAEGGTRFLPFKKVIWSNPLAEPPDMEDAEICICYVRDFSTLENVYTWLHSGKHPFRSVVIDSISEAQQRCVDSIAGIKQMQMQNWGELLRRISGLIRSYRDLLIHPLNPLDSITFIAMERISQEGKHTPYLQGQIANVLAYYLDLSLYLRAEPNAETGVMERKLLTQPHPQFATGDRTGRLPNIIINPTMVDVLKMACDVDREIQINEMFPDLSAEAEDNEFNQANIGDM